MSTADGPVIRVGLMGTGGIAKLHSAGARNLGWQEWTGDYRALVERPDVDLVDITMPNHLRAAEVVDAVLKLAASGAWVSIEAQP